MKKIMIFPIIYIVALLGLDMLHLKWPSVLSLIKVTEIGLSGPVLLTIFLCCFIYIYYLPIYNFLKEIYSIKTPLGEALRQEKATGFEEMEEYIDKIMEKDQEIKSSKKKAADWMFAYANIFLTYKIKLILETICNRERMDIELFDKLCLSKKINQQEKNNILSALRSLEFISTENNSLSIEPWGKYYVTYMRSTKQI